MKTSSAETEGSFDAKQSLFRVISPTSTPQVNENSSHAKVFKRYLEIKFHFNLRQESVLQAKFSFSSFPSV